MPTLPIIDLLIFCGWSSVTIGGALKAIHVSTQFRPTLLTLTPIDFLELAMMFFLFALALAARTLVKASEPGLLARQRAATTRDTYNAAQAAAQREGGGGADSNSTASGLGEGPVVSLAGRGKDSDPSSGVRRLRS